jgi:hypothetical protein
VKNVARGILLLFLLLTLVACPPAPPNPTQFDIELRYAPNFPAQYKPAFEIAKRRWQDIIIGDVPDANGLWDVNTSCGLVGQPPVTAVDDLVIYVGVFTPAQTDGIGGLYGKAGPCDFRAVSFLPITATMDFDTPDLADAQTTGELNSLVLHEMAHALGFGTIWGQKGLVTETQNSVDCGQDPQFTGINAVREYQALGGTGNIPLETQRGLAECNHWLETLFSAEIVTANLDANVANPISRMTIGAMEDLGYLVDYARAEPYALPNIVNNAEYNIRILYDKDFPESYKQNFKTAALRWKSVITGDIPNLQGVFNPVDCGISKLTRYSGIDDIIIYAGIVPVAQQDGVGGFTKRAEPCLTRDGSFLPAIGVMQYDPSDLNSLSTVANVIRDMGRVLGFGTNWIKKDLIAGFEGQNLCSTDSFYIGLNAVNQYHAIGRTGNIGLDNSSDRVCAQKWSQSSSFRYELMGGGLEKPLANGTTSPPALSKITIGAMQDLGYTVDYSAADPFGDQFNIELRFLPGFPAASKPIIEANAHFWEQVITGDIADVPGVTSSTACNFTFEQIPSPYVLPPVTAVDDVVLYVGLKPTIADPNYPNLELADGPGKNLAVGTVCAVRTQGNNSNLPIISKIEFDPADIPSVTATTQQINYFKDTAIHEMAHDLGFGTIWDLYPGLKLATPDDTRCGNNPQFTGLNAKREYERLGGTGNVPVSTSKEGGSCGHWAEGMFSDEIMTPVSDPTQFSPLSRVTIASMADLGYTVNYAKADADDYHLPDPPENTNYGIELVYDRAIDPRYRKYFIAAANRWVKVITGDIPDMHGIFDPMDGNCNIDHQSKFSGIDDIKIFVDLVPETPDVPNFKRIEPCLNRPTSFLPAIGVMQSNLTEFARRYPLLSNPNPSDAEIAVSQAVANITRDMGRVLGFGTNWVNKGLIYTPPENVDGCFNTSYYNGINALREYRSISTINNNLTFDLVVGAESSVSCSLWQFQDGFTQQELMGNIEYNPAFPYPLLALSKITVGAMQDLGYIVDYSMADCYDVLPPVCNPGCAPAVIVVGCAPRVKPRQTVR